MGSPNRTYQSLVVNLLPDEFVLAEGVAGLSGDRVYRPLLHLLLYGTVEHEERLAGTLLVEIPTSSGESTARRWRRTEGGGRGGDPNQNKSYSGNANVSAGSIKRAEQQKLDICEKEGESERASEANDGEVNRRLTTTEGNR